MAINQVVKAGYRPWSDFFPAFVRCCALSAIGIGGFVAVMPPRAKRCIVCQPKLNGHTLVGRALRPADHSGRMKNVCRTTRGFRVMRAIFGSSTVIRLEQNCRISGACTICTVMRGRLWRMVKGRTGLRRLWIHWVSNPGRTISCGVAQLASHPAISARLNASTVRWMISGPG